jgi:formate dehydrogenase iron-sulfur subunit
MPGALTAGEAKAIEKQAARADTGNVSSRKGFFTDTTLCIGCKACEVACKQWNQLPGDGLVFTGMSNDNTVALGASTWRHVAFIERPVALSTQDAGAYSGLLSSDVCKHCARAGWLESRPTGVIVRTESDSVYVQPDICNGCGYCVVNCPFGVIDRRVEDCRAWKGTPCYDPPQGRHGARLRQSLSHRLIKFGDLEELRQTAFARVTHLQNQGMTEADLYGADAAAQPGTGGLERFLSAGGQARSLQSGRPTPWSPPCKPKSRGPRSRWRHSGSWPWRWDR